MIDSPLAMTLKNINKAFLTGPITAAKINPRRFPAQSGGKNVKLFVN
jgi:hypothetical protein